MCFSRNSSIPIYILCILKDWTKLTFTSKTKKHNKNLNSHVLRFILKIRTRTISVKLLKDTPKIKWNWKLKNGTTFKFYNKIKNYLIISITLKVSWWAGASLPRNAWYHCIKLFQTRKEWKQFRTAFAVTGKITLDC